MPAGKQPTMRVIPMPADANHTGDIFGLPSKILMSIASIMAPVQLLTGVMLWWRRKKRGRA